MDKCEEGAEMRTLTETLTPYVRRFGEWLMDISGKEEVRDKARDYKFLKEVCIVAVVIIILIGGINFFYNTGFRDGVSATHYQILNETLQCNSIPVRYNNQTFSLVLYECLQLSLNESDAGGGR